MGWRWLTRVLVTGKSVILKHPQPIPLQGHFTPCCSSCLGLFLSGSASPGPRFHRDDEIIVWKGPCAHFWLSSKWIPSSNHNFYRRKVSTMNHCMLLDLPFHSPLGSLEYRSLPISLSSVGIHMVSHLEELWGLGILYPCMDTTCIHPNLDVRSSHNIINSLTGQISCTQYLPFSWFPYWTTSTLKKLRAHFSTCRSVSVPLVYTYRTEIIIMQLCTELCSASTLFQEKINSLYIALKTLCYLCGACLGSFILNFSNP